MSQQTPTDIVRQTYDAFMRKDLPAVLALQADDTEWSADGDQVVALGYQKGHVRSSGVPYEFDFVHVWALRGQKITRFRVYYDTAYVGSVLRSRSPS
jgi:uncharacterized protein